MALSSLRARLKSEFAVPYIVVAVSLAALIPLSFIYHPVGYIRLVTEDNLGEFGTAICHLIAATMLLVSATKPVPRSTRIIWIALACVAVFIAGEEISWGKRLFELTVPEGLEAINTQRDLTIHNIESVRRIGAPAEILSQVILFWSVVSLAAALFFAATFSAWLARGVPFIPPALIPMFLTVPLFSLSEVPGNSLEVGELLFAVSVLLWSFENARRHWMVDREGPGAMLRGGLVLVAIPLALTIGATAAFHMENQLRKRLNQYAAVTYPKLEMFAQAQEVYRYIFANPIYVTADTRLSYATMLIANGAVCDGLEQLARTVGSIERDIGADGASASDLRRLASAYALMGKDDLARETFDRAVELDRRSLAATTDPNGLTPILWSLSKSFKAMGDLDEALASAEDARRRATYASERWALDRWVGSLKRRIRDRDEEADGAAEAVRAFAPPNCAGPAP